MGVARGRSAWICTDIMGHIGRRWVISFARGNIIAEMVGS